MKIALKNTQLGLRNSTTRLPFRYGSACLTRCPQAIMEATIESGGRRAVGFSGDCLPPGWFDKSPGKDFAEQIDNMLSVIALAEKTFREELSHETAFFPAWLTANERVHHLVADSALPPLLAAFGISMVERAMVDAACRLSGLRFFDVMRDNLLGIDAGEVHPGLAGHAFADWLPQSPSLSIYVRHTVGLADPLTEADIPDGQRIEDGFPHSLEDYIRRDGIRYFKIKVSNRLDHDMERLRAIAALIERHRGSDYRVTLDGNEQYKQASQFDRLVDSLRSTPQLRTFLANTLLIEQPLDRKIALDEAHTAGVRDLSGSLPVIIDESDSTFDAYPRALELGYRGVSSKCCKGPIKSLFNAGLTWLNNDRGVRSTYLTTGEDLCCVGIVPVQSDLCLAATLGLTHVERNGHHYHPGLSYLPESQQRAALAAHGDLYGQQHGRVAPRVVDGQFRIGSLQCPGFGFAVEPDFDSMESPANWRYESLGL